MPKTLIVRKNEYHDSIQLMRVSQSLRALEGVNQAMVAMATDTNKEILRDLGMMNDAGLEAGVNDMLVGLDGASDAAIAAAVEEMDGLFKRKEAAGQGTRTHRSFDSALKAMPDANLCVITIPGEHAAAEARKALEAGLHVHIYSDNVPIAQEKELKELARSKGLLCMGPECGVANINGVALGTASAVRKGPIGIAGASGSGVQQIAVLVEREGLGVSQAIGLGGKDLKDEIGGMTMLMAIDALEEDPETLVVVLVSRPPGARTMPAVLARVQKCKKPVVAYFIGGDPTVVKAAGAIPATDLEDAALKAVALARNEKPVSRVFTQGDAEIRALVERERAGMAPGQKYLRGLFCGGTFCEEALMLLRESIGDAWSNAPLIPQKKLPNAREPKEHSIIDLGDEEFTKGRPHPVIDPEPIRQAILREGARPEVAVILMDFILSPAIHPDPVGAVADAIAKVKADREKSGGRLCFVASVCGGEGDPQSLSAQEESLRKLGVVAMPSNAQAARLAGLIAKEAGA
jgi:FdrA protein